MHRGGGNSLKPSHNQCFNLIEAFNNLALWGENKFVSELKRTYKFKRGVNNILDCHANQTRILSKEYSFVAGDYVRSTAHFLLKRVAFTLAEVLITLGIIGVVAAMTMPSLVQNYKNKQTVAQLKKIYSVLSQVTVMAESENGPISDWNMVDGSCESMDEIVSFYTPYLKTLKDCKQSKGCWATTTIKGLSGTTNRLNEFSDSFDCAKHSIALTDGTYIVFDIYSDLTSLGIQNDMPNDTNSTMAFFVDLNGQKNPNIVGKDIFAFALTKHGIAPAGIHTNSVQCSRKLKNANSGIDCAAKVLKEEDLKY